MCGISYNIETLLKCKITEKKEKKWNISKLLTKSKNITRILTSQKKWTYTCTLLSTDYRRLTDFGDALSALEDYNAYVSSVLKVHMRVQWRPSRAFRHVVCGDEGTVVTPVDPQHRVSVFWDRGSELTVWMLKLSTTSYLFLPRLGMSNLVQIGPDCYQLIVILK